MATTVAITAVQTHLSQFIGVDHQYVMTEADGTVLTGFALSFMIKRRASDLDADALVTLTTSGGAISISGAAATVSVADTDTDSLSAGSYAWELKRTDAGAETVLGYGQLRLMRGVHHT
jgi:hypothetical protein